MDDNTHQYIRTGAVSWALVDTYGVYGRHIVLVSDRTFIDIYTTNSNDFFDFLEYYDKWT